MSMPHIRLARPEDIDAIYQIHRHSVQALCRQQYTSGQIAMWLDGRQPDMYLPAIHQQRLWLAECRHVLGFVENEGKEISKLFVSGEHAFRGIGRQLLQIALADMACRGMDRAYLESTLTAVPFYEKNGFRIIGHGVFSRGNSPLALEIVKMELLLAP